MTEATPDPKKPLALAGDVPAREDAERGVARERIDESLVQPADSNRPNAATKKHTPDSSYQSYLFGKGGASDTPAWSDSTKGRFYIRMFSRGLVGAAFFTIGGRMAEKQLEGYHVNTWSWNPAKPLQTLAYGIDRILGTPIKSGVRFFAQHGGSNLAPEVAAHNAVTFRNTRSFPDANGVYHQGRSYGADAVGFTFDFAMASIGDAMTRNLIQVIDPNVKKNWLVNDAGEAASKGESKHIVWGELGKSFLKSSWRIFSKNQGEDWAAAIPYAFQMKFQRQFLSKIFGGHFDGHQHVFDNGWNGGAYRTGMPHQSISHNRHNITGDYQLVGAVDLHLRFTGYNWYTLMYREGYDAIGNALTKWKEDGYKINLHMPEHFNPLTAAVDAVGTSMRYVAKSFIKANMYMNPAVVPFWLFRVPQSKWRADNMIEPVDVWSRSSTADTHMRLGNSTKTGDFKAFNHWNPLKEPNYNYTPVTGIGKAEKWFSQALHPIGYFSHWLGGHAANLGEHILPRSGPLGRLIGSTPADRTKFMRSYVDASLSYTPYMFAKQEFGLRVDDNKGDGKPGQMDLAIYKFMDNVASFNLHGTKESLKEMWKLGTNFERDIPVREGTTNIASGPTTKPQTTVSANTVNHDPVNLARGEASNDASIKGPDAANEPQADPHAGDKRWAQAVVGGDYHAARFQPGGASRH